MLKSMTAFGRGQAQAHDGAWVVELRCVNSRFLDPHFRLPHGLAGLEDRIKKALAVRLTRGRINIAVKAAGAVEAPPRLILNKPLVHEYRRVLEELKAELGLSGDPGLGPFLANRDLVLVEDASPDLDQLWAELEPAFRQALDEVEAMRSTEGANLAKDLAERLDLLEELFSQAAAQAPLVVENYRVKLKDRVAQIMADLEPDANRLAMEVAILADKCDVTEEAVRAQSHLGQFRESLEANEPVGRKLDFLLQELNREANTMTSKLPDAKASQLCVDIKTELERLREQVQNIE
ncbi:hypothetical protein AAU61_18310 [Desulfocarbo indianensis]|nr:hypothetical protein AAU61_18310 [Desulfocarbo indianensis]